MKRSRVLAAAVAAAALVALAGCSSSSGGDGKTIKVAFQDYGSDIMSNFMNKAKTDFEKANPGSKITLVPIKAAENDYYTKLALMNRAATTAPDIMSEDTFLIRADAQAGYLAPLDSYVSKWSDWSNFFDNAKDAGKGDDGKVLDLPRLVALAKSAELVRGYGHIKEANVARYRAECARLEKAIGQPMAQAAE